LLTRRRILRDRAGPSRWWLHHSLRALSSDLQKRGASFVLRRGNTAKVLLDLAKSFDASTVYWNRRYAPDHVALDTDLKSMLTDAGLDVVSENGALLREPWEIKTGGGGHFKVFSPFWRALQKAGPGRIEPAPAPRKFTAPERAAETDALENWNLTPSAPNWATAFPETWTPGEKGAKARLDAFLKSAAARYDDHRNRPDFEGTSRLSPHLAFGEISPLQIWAATKIRLDAGDVPETPAMTFLSEIAWREFSHVLLYHYADLRSAPIRPDFERFPWRNDEKTLNAWRRGRTGYPIVDAGMRELWTTGWMHNRVRMITASFLVKHLLSPWQEGEKWFWDTLVDADPANNAASWQWSAGCGADAAPYFRIFNPMTQGEKFDPDGAYTRKYVPELAELPNKYLQKPWTAPAAVLKDAGVVLGDTYPEPIVDHAAARQAALDAFNSIKKT
ncbi:MAG: deoxyribodipyrimidine photo-lyase, partial [Pseudomonadota bacterium]